MKNKKVLKKFFKSNKYLIILFVLLFLFPIVIGLFYALPFPQIVAVGSGDLLSYYGAFFGIVGSFVTYRIEIAKRKKERIKEIKPVFIVEVKKINEDIGIFSIDIINRSQKTVAFLYLYDEFISPIINEKYSFKITYNKSIDDIKRINPDYNITMDSEIVDTDGFPKYIQLLCNDSDGNDWNCYYDKIKNCDKVYYFPSDVKII